MIGRVFDDRYEVIRKLGSGGIDLEFGSQNNTIVGCTFRDISGSAVQVGDVLKDDHHPDDPRKIVKNNAVVNNCIHDCCVEYMGGVGVFAGYTDGTVAKIPARAVNDGEVLRFGNRRFTVYGSTDAHSKTDIMLLTDSGVLFTGDNVLNARVARMDDGTFLGNIREIERAQRLPARHVVPGHGAPGGPELLQAQRTYFQTLYDSVKTEYDAGRSDFEMKPVVTEKLAAFKHWHGFAENLGRQISLVVLEVEQQ